jgi:hypothetical protein
MRPNAPSYLADFDSASAMLRATTNILRGKDFPTLGQPPALTPLVRSVNMLPRPVREQVYALGGAMEGQAPDKLDKVNAEAIAHWAAERYPKRPYQAVMIGSSNGALVHMSAALDIPWLPQTCLIPVRHLGTDPDDPIAAMEFGKEYARQLLDANPEWQLHHMHDANQDRLMVRHMDYFRVKRLNLGRAYERFLTNRLQPGGTIILVDCQRKWPSTRIDEHHVFQHGALGGATEEEFMEGSPRVAEYLDKYGANVQRWESPKPNEETPEAEWGFEDAMREDALRFAAKHGYKVQRLSFYEPEHLSPLVADFYRDWYRLRGLKANRLLVESFISMEPYWALRTGSVPFWMKFNMEPSVECIENYLDNREPFDEINLMLFNNGVEAAGFPQIDRWKKVLERARKRGRFIGVRPDLHPRDFGSLARYHTDMKKLAPRYPIPGPLPLKRFTDFMQRSDQKYAVELRDE